MTATGQIGEAVADDGVFDTQEQLEAGVTIGLGFAGPAAGRVLRHVPQLGSIPLDPNGVLPVIRTGLPAATATRAATSWSPQTGNAIYTLFQPSIVPVSSTAVDLYRGLEALDR